MALTTNGLSFSGSAALIVIGAFVLGALMVSGTELRRPRADVGLRGLAGGLMGALVAGAFAAAPADVVPAASSPVASNAAAGSSGAAGAQPGQAASPGATPAPGATPGSQPGGAGAPGGSSALSGGSGSSRSGAGTTSSGGGHTGPTQQAAAANLPPLVVGYIGVNPNDQEVQAEANAGLVPPPADPNKQAQVMQDYVNSHGGINGRKLSIDVKERSPSSTSSSQELDLCTQLTEGDHVFLTMGGEGGNNGDAEACYAKAHTPFLCDCAEDQGAMQQGAPYIWTPGTEFDAASYGALVQALGQEGFFANGTKLGIPIDDTPQYHQLLNNTLLPIIQKYHSYSSSDIVVYNVKDAQSAADFGQLGTDMQQAAVTFNGDGVNRVFFLYDGDLPAQDFMTAAESQQYHPIYGLHTSNHPYLTLQKEVPADQLVGSMGEGNVQAADVDPEHETAFPDGSGETQCRDIMKAGGLDPGPRFGMLWDLPLCDGVLMLVDAAQGLGASFTAEQWAASANQLGTRFQSAEAYPNTTRFIPNRYSGEDGYRDLHYVTDCSGDADADPNGGGCFQYFGSVQYMPF